MEQATGERALLSPGAGPADPGPASLTDLPRWPKPRPRPGVHRAEYRDVALCGPLLVDDLDDRRNEFPRHDDDGLALGQKSGFVLRELFVFGLVVVVLGKLANSRFIPARGIDFVSFGNLPRRRTLLR